MADANELVRAMKRAALESMEASKPADVCFGKVLGLSPLEIRVEQKMTLGKAQLVLTRNVTDYTTEITAEWETEPADIDMTHTHEGSVEVRVSSSGASDAGEIPISNTVESSMSVGNTSLQDTHQHRISGRKKITVHNALAAGDEVILIRQQGGQKFVVLDRIG